MEFARNTVGTWLSLVERTLGVGEVASSNLVVPTIYFQSLSIWEKVQLSTLAGPERSMYLELLLGSCLAAFLNEQSSNRVLCGALVCRDCFGIDGHRHQRRCVPHEVLCRFDGSPGSLQQRRQRAPETMPADLLGNSGAPGCRKDMPLEHGVRPVRLDAKAIRACEDPVLGIGRSG